MLNAVILAGIALSLFCLSRYLFDPLKAIPGPILARFTSLWELREALKGHIESVNLALHKKYGPIVRLAPGRYSINDPSAVKILYGHGAKFPKTSFYTPFAALPALPNLFSGVDVQQHSDAKRKVASLYSVTALVSYERFVDRCTAQFTQVLGEFADQGKSFHAPTWLQYYAFDVIGEITVGRPFGLMDNRADYQHILAGIDHFNGSGMLLGVFSGDLWYHTTSAMQRLLQMLKVKQPVGSVQKFLTAEIERRMIEGAQDDRPDFLAKAFALREQGKIGDIDVRNVVGSNIGAGSDTTAISLSSVIYHLMQNPECLKKLQQELDAAVAEGSISDPITYKEAQQLPYLQAVIKEALRIHPATGLIHSREVPAGGAMIAGIFFPEGTHVGVNPWALHHNPQVFGEDADKFRPDRWLGPKEQVSFYEQNFLAFGLGSRSCIGKNISLLEMSKLLPQLYRQFEFVSDRDDGIVTRKTFNNWFVKPDFTAKVRRRQL